MRFLNFPKLNKHSLCKRFVSILAIHALFLCSFFSQATPAYAVTEDEKIEKAALSAKGFEFIILSSYKDSLKIGQTKLLIAVSTMGSDISFKSSKSSVASVDMYGVVTAKKAGKAKITAKSKGAEASCEITVERTVITLNTKKISIENGATYRMSAKTSSGNPVNWKSSKQSVAIISDYGVVNAIKPGKTVITASTDGSKETCILTVKKPTINLNSYSISLKQGQKFKLKVTVSSGNTPTYKCSSSKTASVDDDGTITAKKKGSCTVSVSSDGTTAKCKVKVTDK
ncbi:MAG: Ig-like domain-containing protein [Eubacterium sp.]|nr:Ig-like domain-containing protein [Eubacterium sp.]